MAWLAGSIRSARAQSPLLTLAHEWRGLRAARAQNTGVAGSIRSASGQHQVSIRSASGQHQVSIRSASGQHQVSIRSASKADTRAAVLLTDYKYKIPVLTHHFLTLIINRLQTLRIMSIMLNTLIHKGFLISSYNYYTNSAAFKGIYT